MVPSGSSKPRPKSRKARMTATTDAQRAAICDLAASLNRLSDKTLLAELNRLLVLFSAT
jgi:hypothetical protein